jgi:hypothetical protein
MRQKYPHLAGATGLQLSSADAATIAASWPAASSPSPSTTPPAS